VIQEGIADTSVHPARKYSLLQRALKICKSQKTPARIKRLPEISVHPYSEKTIYARTHPRKNQASYALFMKPTSSPSGNSQDFELVSVEEFSLVHYKENEGWTRGVHCEGSAFSTLFALLFWDVIFFYDVPNVFRSRYQHLPMDFNTPGFYVNRKTAIDERLEWIKSATKEAIGCKVEQAWREYNEERCGLLSWNLVNSAEDIKTLSMCLGPDLLWRVCTLYATLTYSHYRSGLPDLLLWRPETLQCKFVEVKGPNDRLSAKQILWLGRLSEWNCEAQVCWVKVK
jgi:Fanconi-associated nuclease 1